MWDNLTELATKWICAIGRLTRVLFIAGPALGSLKHTLIISADDVLCPLLAQLTGGTVFDRPNPTNGLQRVTWTASVRISVERGYPRICERSRGRATGKLR